MGNRDDNNDYWSGSTYQADPEPIAIPGLNGAKILAVEAGDRRNFVLDDQNRIWAWGMFLGKFAGLNTSNAYTPFQLDTSPLAGAGIVAISSTSAYLFDYGGYYGTLVVLDSNGQVWLLDLSTDEGFKPLNQTAFGGSPVQAIDAGFDHYLLLDSSQRLWAWGNNTYKALGNNAGSGNDPVLVGSLDPLDVSADLTLTEPRLSISAARKSLISVGDIRVDNPSFVGSSLYLDNASGFRFEGNKTQAEVNNVGAKDVTVYLDPSMCTTPGQQDVALNVYDQTERLLASKTIEVVCEPDLTITLQNNSNNGTTDLSYHNTAPTDYIVRFTGVSGVMSGGNAIVERLVCAGCNVSASLDYTCPRYALEPIGTVEILETTGVSIGTQAIYCPRKDVMTFAIAGDNASYFIKGSNLWGWGNGFLGDSEAYSTSQKRIPGIIDSSMLPGSGFTSLVGGSDHILGLSSSSTIWSWGAGNGGKLGHGNPKNWSLLPDAVDMTELNALNDNAKIVSLAAGNTHSVALDSLGRVWVWGNNDYGQLGLLGASQEWIPQLVDPLIFAGKKIVSVKALGNYNMALDEVGGVWEWGRTTPHNIPRQVDFAGADVGTVVDFAFGSDHKLVLNSLGQVWGWGSNYYGQLGTGASGIWQHVTVPTRVDTTALGSVGILAISAGSYHSLLLDANGNVWTWGLNDAGQLGISGFAQIARPTLINHAPLLGKKIVQLLARGNYNMALDEDNHVWAWGAGYNYQLGTGLNQNSYEPVPVRFPFPAEKVTLNLLATRELFGIEGVIVPLEIAAEDEGDYVIRLSSSDFTPRLLNVRDLQGRVMYSLTGFTKTEGAILLHLPRGEYLVEVSSETTTAQGDFNIDVKQATEFNYAEFLNPQDPAIIEWWGVDCGDAGELGYYGACEWWTGAA
jgi:alpha-tubulin suppressor-like RCC1 family protein